MATGLLWHCVGSLYAVCGKSWRQAGLEEGAGMSIYNICLAFISPGGIGAQH